MVSYASEIVSDLPQTKLFRHVDKALSKCRFIRLFEVEIQIPIRTTSFSQLVTTVNMFLKPSIAPYKVGR